jgi:hypothetical protein
VETSKTERSVSPEDNSLAETCFDAAVDALANSQEFRPYREFHKQILDSERLDRVGLIADTAIRIDTERASRGERMRKTRRTLIVALVAVAVLLAVLITLSAFFESTNNLALSGVMNLIGLVSIFGLFGLGASLYEVLNELSNLEVSVRADAQSALFKTLESRYALATRDELAALGVLEFPRSAPRLVELGTASVVTSRSIERIGRFVDSHVTSTLGISGPRGVGKTTVIDGMASRIRDRGGIAVVHSAPVEYSPVDLLRSIAFSLLEEVDGGFGKRLRIAVLSVVTLAMGTLVLLAALLPVVVESVLSFFGAAWVFFLAGAVLLIGVAFLIRAIWRPTVAPLSRDPSALLRRLVADLEYEKKYSGYLGGGGQGLPEFRLSNERSRRQLTHADLVKGLRSALRALSGPDGKIPILVAIDELDKLPDRDAAIRVINVLKDLHRIPGIHMLVTVSDEAQASFGLFGQLRDAFDSTFDSIFEVERLSFETARDIVDSRVVGFPLELLVVCHICSAGLPRDLIRHARALVDFTIERDAVPRWVELARLVGLDDAQAMLTAHSRLSSDLEDFPAAVGTITGLANLNFDELIEASPPQSIGDSLARIYVRTVLRLLAIEWVRLADLSDKEAVGPMIERLRDSMLLADQPGAARAALRVAAELIQQHRLRTK